MPMWSRILWPPPGKPPARVRPTSRGLTFGAHSQSRRRLAQLGVILRELGAAELAAGKPVLLPNG